MQRLVTYSVILVLIAAAAYLHWWGERLEREGFMGGSLGWRTVRNDELLRGRDWKIEGDPATQEIISGHALTSAGKADIAFKIVHTPGTLKEAVEKFAALRRSTLDLFASSPLTSQCLGNKAFDVIGTPLPDGGQYKEGVLTATDDLGVVRPCFLASDERTLLRAITFCPGEPGAIYDVNLQLAGRDFQPMRKIFESFGCGLDVRQPETSR